MGLCIYNTGKQPTRVYTQRDKTHVPKKTQQCSVSFFFLRPSFRPTFTWPPPPPSVDHRPLVGERGRTVPQGQGGPYGQGLRLPAASRGGGGSRGRRDQDGALMMVRFELVHFILLRAIVWVFAPFSCDFIFAFLMTHTGRGRHPRMTLSSSTGGTPI